MEVNKVNKNKFIKYFLISLFIICILIGGCFIGIKGIGKGKTFLLAINNQLASMSSSLKALENTNENDNIIIKDSISNLKVKLIFGDKILYLNTEKDGITYDLDTLNTDQSIKFYLETTGDIEIKINDNEMVTNQWNEIKIDELSMSNRIKISLNSKDNRDSRNYFINTLPVDFPQYNLVGKSPYKGDYYLTIQGGSPYYLLKLSNEGDVIYYKRSEENMFFDFKKHMINGKVRYSYQEVDTNKDSVISSEACSLGDIVILDEKYNEIDRVNFMGNDEVIQGYPVENHDFLMIDDGHYIISTYLPMIVNNIPETVESLSSSTKVLATVLQEVKDGKVVFQWNSTDYPELYELSVEGNRFNQMSSTWNDYAHFNAVIVDSKDNNLICSFRHLDALLKIDRNSGDIVWILGGKGDEFGLTENQKFSHQHHLTLLDENRILLYDNGNARSLTRVLELTLDEENKKVTDFKEFSVDNRFSAFMGSVQKLDDENDVYLVGWGGAQSDTALFTEYDLKNNQVLCEFHSVDDSKMVYRVYKSE